MNPSTRKLRHLLDEPEEASESSVIVFALSVIATIVAALWIAAVIAYWITK